jgi:hypothetical protein
MEGFELTSAVHETFFAAMSSAEPDDEDWYKALESDGGAWRLAKVLHSALLVVCKRLVSSGF